MGTDPIRKMHREIHASLQKRSNGRHLGIRSLWKVMVRKMRRISPMEDRRPTPEAPDFPQQPLHILHDHLCPKFVRNGFGVERVSIDMESLHRSIQVEENGVEECDQLDWRQRNYDELGDWDQPPSTYDCRFFYPPNRLPIVKEGVVQIGWLSCAHGHIKDPYWPCDCDQLPVQIPLQTQATGLLGWVEPDPMLSIRIVSEGKESYFSIPWFSTSDEDTDLSDVL